MVHTNGTARTPSLSATLALTGPRDMPSWAGANVATTVLKDRGRNGGSEAVAWPGAKQSRTMLGRGVGNQPILAEKKYDFEPRSAGLGVWAGGHTAVLPGLSTGSQCCRLPSP